MAESDIVLKVENLSKVYRLGEVGTGTISHDLNRWWARVRGKEDPFATVGSVNDRTQKAAKGEYVKALSDINFEVKRGEVLGIIGKNGAGKSTLLKVISQITAPTTGSIKAKGRIASLLEVGTGMHPEMTGKENVYLNGTILGMTRREIDAKFEEIMDFAGCAKYADTPVKRYSSGMKVRLGFAVAAFLEPEILIVDEVLAVGDAEFQKKAIGKMQDISAGGGRTVLFVSHNMESVSKLCSRSLLLVNGAIQFEGKTDEVIGVYRKHSLNKREFPKQLAEIFQIRSFSLGEDTIISGHSCSLEISLVCRKEISIYDMALLILNENDVRVSVIPLKRYLDNDYSDGDGIRIIHDINKMNLIEGHYFLGLWINSNLIRGNFEALVDFQVSEQNLDYGATYPTSVRGFVQLES